MHFNVSVSGIRKSIFRKSILTTWLRGFKPEVFAFLYNCFHYNVTNIDIRLEISEVFLNWYRDRLRIFFSRQVQHGKECFKTNIAEVATKQLPILTGCV